VAGSPPFYFSALATAVFSNMSVNNCSFVSNKADWGAAVYIEPAMCGGIKLVNCVFNQNTADSSGGGLAMVNTVANVLNCTFYGNTAGTDGAAMSISSSSPQISNCILWNNTVDASEDEVYIDSPFTTFSHCDIYGCGGSDNWQLPGFGIDAGGNIDTNPLFKDPGDPDGPDGAWATTDDGLMPGPKSPCINRAYYWHGESDCVWLDVIGRVRNEVSSYPDIGAYESSHKIILAMCFIDETHGVYYDQNYEENDPDPTTYTYDISGFNSLLANFPYEQTKYSILKAGCIVPPYGGADYRHNIADVLPTRFFYQTDPPAVLPPDQEPVGLSIAECGRPPTGDELIAHFHRIREGVVPDCIIRSIDHSWPLDGSLGDGYDDFIYWLKNWLEWHGINPYYYGPDPVGYSDVLPAETEFYDEQWIKAITVEVTSVVSQ